MNIELGVNGEKVNLAVRSVDRLVDVLRAQLDLSSLSPDCRSGRCGRCLIFMDGLLVPSCQVPAFRARGCEIVTLEGFSRTEKYRDIVAGFHSAGLVTCGFCDSARIMATADLLEREPQPSAASILAQMDAVSCRCSEPELLVAAVTAAAVLRSGRIYARAGK
jgi:carbon-monoxide dehydrogenase small subunit